MMGSPAIFIGILAGFCAIATLLKAEPVFVQAGERGQGLLVSHAGNCYLVFPRHVAADRQRAQVITEGGESGTVSVRTPFWSGFDLAVGPVRQAASRRCTTGSAELLGPPPAVARSGEGDLLLISEEGLVRRHRMRITETRHLEFDAEFTDPAQQVQQGMSGAFLVADGRLLGMARASPDGRIMIFVRMEEIAMNLGRWLGSQAGQFDPSGPQPESPGSDRPGLKLTLIEASLPGIGADLLAENVLTGEGAYVFEPRGYAVLVLGIDGAKSGTISRLRMTSRDEEGTSLPRGIAILVSNQASGESWRSFWSGEMPPDGLLDTGPRAETRAQRLKIVISSAWEPGPVRIDRVTVE